MYHKKLFLLAIGTMLLLGLATSHCLAVEVAPLLALDFPPSDLGGGVWQYNYTWSGLKPSYSLVVTGLAPVTSAWSWVSPLSLPPYIAAIDFGLGNTHIGATLWSGAVPDSFSFVFKAPVGPGTANYQILNGSGGCVLDPPISGPAPTAAVPEPSLAALLLVAGLPAFLAYRKRKRS